MKMSTQIRALLLLLSASCLASVTLAATGTATFYYAVGIGACGTNLNGGNVAAACGGLWENGAACNKKYSVTCTGGPCKSGSVTVTILDRCSSSDTLDLSSDAFAVIADPAAGRINIEYNQV
ncbi:EG45-like domain containing protein [Diospyros lotus]|uniref:EG45-like domain containing protein n=1 Tax=Diospyros lotus TaxID=55363 RepID=UPI002252EB44|nr:EG45-like domain containing protein [Diospyros lotus]